jgi:hypothetical protein
LEEIVLTLPKPPSLNKIYAGVHWTTRTKYKNDYKTAIKEQLALFDKFTCESYSLDISYNSRLDIDNGILVSKFLSDCLVQEGYVADDTPTYFKSVKIQFEGSLPKNTYIVRIKLTGYKLDGC